MKKIFLFVFLFLINASVYAIDLNSGGSGGSGTSLTPASDVEIHNLRLNGTLSWDTNTAIGISGADLVYTIGGASLLSMRYQLLNLTGKMVASDTIQMGGADVNALDGFSSVKNGTHYWDENSPNNGLTVGNWLGKSQISSFDKDFNVTTLNIQPAGGDTAVGGSLSVSGVLYGDGSGLTNISVSGSAVQPIAGNGAYYYLDDRHADNPTTWNVLSRIPSTGATVIDNIILTQAQSPSLSEVYIDSTLNVTSIPAGEWEHDLYCYADSAIGASSISINWYLKTAAGAETFLFSVNSGEINNTSVALITIRTVQPAFACNLTDRLIIKVYGIYVGAGTRTISFTHNGNANYTKVRVPLDTLHNQLLGIQGGKATAYYHSDQAINQVSNVTFNQVYSKYYGDGSSLTGITGAAGTVTSNFTGNVTVNGTFIATTVNQRGDVPFQSFIPSWSIYSGETMPVFSDIQCYYEVKNGYVYLYMYLDGDGGAEGNGTHAMFLILPVGMKLPLGSTNSSVIFGSGHLRNNTTNDALIGLQYYGNSKQVYLKFASRTGNLLPSSLNHTDRQLYFSAVYKAE